MNKIFLMLLFFPMLLFAQIGSLILKMVKSKKIKLGN